MYRIAGAIGAGLLVAAGSAVADDVKESTTVGAKAFVDLTNIDQSSNGVAQPANGTGVDIKRFYVIVNHAFDATWAGNVTTDFNYSSSTGETQVYIKKAYLQAKLADAATVRLGSADLPWVPYVENLYGYRYVEQELLDRLKFGTSADWGVHAAGTVAPAANFGYALSAINGNGYKNPSRSKNLDIEGRISVQPLPGLSLAAGFYSGKLGKDVQGAVTHNSADRLDLLAAYVNEQWRVGAEYFAAKNWKQVTAVATDKADGYSLWAAFAPRAGFSVFARYDTAKPSKTLVPALKDTYFNVGVAYAPRKNVELALVYKDDKIEHGSWATGSGTIGGSAGGEYREIGLWSQFGF